MGLEILTDLLKRFTSAIPNIFAAFLIAFVGSFIARAAGKITAGVLAKTGIDSVAAKLNEIDIVQQYNFQFQISAILGNIIRYMLLLIFLIAATDVLGMPAVSNLIGDLINYVPNLISALIVLVVGLLVANAIKNLVLNTCKSLAIPSAGLIANFVFYFIFLTVLISALSQAKIDTSFVKNNLSIILAGGVAAFSLGYGLASRDMMANFLASFYSKGRFHEGDIIRIENVLGQITAIDSTSCVLRSLEDPDKIIIIPLSKLTRENVEILTNKFIEQQK